MKTAEHIGTAKLSELPYPDCCTVFLPESPVVRPELYKVKKEQAKIDFDKIIERALQNIEVVEIKAD